MTVCNVLSRQYTADLDTNAMVGVWARDKRVCCLERVQGCPLWVPVGVWCVGKGAEAALSALTFDCRLPLTLAGT